MTKLTLGNWYKIKTEGETHIGQYTGKEDGFECCICGKGCKASCFNIWYGKDGYETWGYGPNHMPEILEDLGNEEEVILDR